MCLYTCLLILYIYIHIYMYKHTLFSCLHRGTSKNINFPFGTNGKLMVLDVPIVKHFRMFHSLTCIS